MLSIRPAAVAELCTRGTRERWKRRCRPAWAAHPAQARRPKLLIVPHAGYVYSGPVAARRMRCSRPGAAQIRACVLLGPTHRWPCAAWRCRRSSLRDAARPRAPSTARRSRRAGDLPQVATQRPRARDGAFAGGAAAVPAGRAGRFRAAAAGGGRRQRRRSGRGARAALGRRRDADRGQHRTCRTTCPTTQARAHRPHDRRRASSPRPRDLDPDEACGATRAERCAARQRGDTACRPRLLDLRNSGDTAGDRRRVVGYAALAFSPRARRGG